MKNNFDGYVIYSDMDGTLLNNKKKVSHENKKAIEKFIENGGKFSIATGRAFEAIEEYLEDVNINMPVIVYNGAMVYDEKKRKPVKVHYFEEEKKDIVNKIKENYSSVAVEIHCGVDIYVFNDNGSAERPATKFLNVIYDMPENLFDLKWNKVVLIGEYEYMDFIQEELKKKYNIDTIRSGKIFVELMPHNTSKGNALEEIINMFNLDKSKVIAAGDDMNDAEMLKKCGIAVCPENASPNVKKYADRIICSNENHIIQNIVELLEREEL